MPQWLQFRLRDRTVDTERSVVDDGERSVRVKPKSMAVLRTLAEAGGAVVSREQVFASVWPNSEVSDDVLTQSITELRKALGDSARSPRFIETIPRKGFRLLVKPVALDGDSEDGATSPTARFAWPAAAMLVLAVLATMVFVARTGPDTDAAGPATRAVAVLPFVDMSPLGDQEYFADGITEELINELVKLEGPRVTGRTSSFYFKGRNEDLRSIGRQLNVSHVLEGSVRLSNDTLRVTAQLIDVSDGYHLWSETFDRQLADVFRIQEEIAENVASSLSISLGVGELARYTGGTSNVEAHRLVLEANARYKMGKPEDAEQAIAMYRRATQLDPSYAIGWERLASAYMFARLVFGPDYWEQTRGIAADAIERALELAPDSSIVLQTAAYFEIVTGDFFAARHYFGRLASADIPIPLARSGSYIDMIMKTGHVEEALRLQRENLLIDPKVAENQMYLAHNLTVSGQAQRALQVVESALTEGEPGIGIALEGLVAALVVDDPERIDAWFARAIAATTNGSREVLSRVRDLHGEPRQALDYLRTRFAESTNDDYLIGLFAGYYGDTELAFAALERSMDFWMFWYPLFDEARATPAFSQLLEDAGLVRYWRTYGWNSFCGEGTGQAVVCR